MFSENRFTSLFSKVNINYCVYFMSSFNVTLMGGSHAQFPLYLDVTDTYTCVINSYNELWDYTPN